MGSWISYVISFIMFSNCHLDCIEQLILGFAHVCETVVPDFDVST